jgi:hypothetical protein
VKNILLRLAIIFGIFMFHDGLYIHAAQPAKIAREDKKILDDFEPVRLALTNYLDAVKQYKGRSPMEMKSYNLSKYIGPERLANISRIQENYERLFKLHDKIKHQNIEVQNADLLQIGSVPRDIIFMANAGFKLDIKKLSENRNLNNVKLIYDIIAHGDEDQKIWQNLKYTASFYFYKSIEKGWILDSLIYDENESARFWTLDGRIAEMNSIEFDAVAKSWERVLGGHSK